MIVWGGVAEPTPDRYPRIVMRCWRKASELLQKALSFCCRFRRGLWIAAICFGMAVTATQVREYAIATTLFLVAAVALIGFSCGWPGIQRHPMVTLVSRIFLAAVGVALIPVSVAWVHKQKGDEPWSVFFKPPSPRLPNEPVTASCQVGLSACQLSCSAENPNATAVRDVAVAFNGVLPTNTRISGPPDARITLEKSDTLPVPDPNRERWTGEKAFTVRIPLVPQGMKIPFSLWTDDKNNQRACQQLLGINHRRHDILKHFFERVRQEVSPRQSVPDLKVLFSAIAKNDELFQPDTVMSEFGRRPVAFKSDTELRALNLYGGTLKSFKARFIDVFQNRGECMAPVFTVEQTPGATTFASFPPDLQTYLGPAFKGPEVRSGQEITVEFRPAPPPAYDCAVTTVDNP